MINLKLACFFVIFGIAYSEWVWREVDDVDDPKRAKKKSLFKGYKSLGCWADKGWPSPRAMDWSGHNFAKETAVKECFGEAASRGMKYFAVQKHSECYISNTDNYKRYETSTGCSDGVGGDWANDVYEVKGKGYRSRPLGCWADQEDRAIKDEFQTYPDYTYQKCLARAIWNGVKVFAIQNQNECFISDDTSYKKYGKATGCENNLGGEYKNNVYLITPDRFEGKSLGCFSDREEDRAISGDVTYYDRDAIESCKQLAADNKAKFFALQNGNECRTFVDEDYDKYGEATGCQFGSGSSYQNNVYKLVG